jgi:hypothetical protein
VATKEEALAALAAKPPHERAWLAARIAAKKEGIDLGGAVNNHVRTPEEQASLYANRDANPNPVAPPGTSHHEASVGGDAWDINEGPARDWLTKRGAEFGLFNNVEGDAPHFQYFPKEKRERPTPPPVDNSWKEGLKGKYEPQLGGAPKGEMPKPSLLDALKSASFSGITAGAGNEIAAYAGAKGQDTRLNPFRIAKGLPTVEDGGFAEDKAARKASFDAKDEAAEAAHPVAYAATELATSLPAAALVGGPVTNAKQAFGAGTKVGALFGLTGSDAETGLEAAPDVAKGAAIGGPLGLLGYGFMKGGERAAQKAGDALFNLRSLFGGEPPVNPGRALDALGVKPGSAPNEKMAQRLDQKVVPPEDFAPNAFRDASPSAPEALAQVAKHPRVQVAESDGIMNAKRGLGFLEENPNLETPEAVRALVDIRRGQLPKLDKSMGTVGDALAQAMKGGRRMLGTTENLARALSGAERAELAQIIAAGREPLAPDAQAALVSRGLALLGADLQD